MLPDEEIYLYIYVIRKIQGRKSGSRWIPMDPIGSRKGEKADPMGSSGIHRDPLGSVGSIGILGSRDPLFPPWKNISLFEMINLS